MLVRRVEFLVYVAGRYVVWSWLVMREVRFWYLVENCLKVKKVAALEYPRGSGTWRAASHCSSAAARNVVFLKIAFWLG